MILHDNPLFTMLILCIYLLLISCTGKILHEEVLITFDHAQAQVDWLRLNDGFFHSELEFRDLFFSNNNNNKPLPKGVYATANITRGELLMIIPNSTILGSGDPELETICDTVDNVIYQRSLGNLSDFAPYINYLYSTPHGQIPSSWSAEGQDLLQNVLHDPDLPPGKKGYTTLSHERKCGKNESRFPSLLSSQEEKEFVYLTVHSRSWDEKLIPVFDMVNHRNGRRWANVDTTSVHRGRDIFVVASQNIFKGQQLYFPYNECTDCEGFATSYVLQHMLRDFGFVEQYPQRWMFPRKLVFDVDEYHDEEERITLMGNIPDDDFPLLRVTWLTHYPRQEEMENLLYHYDRLENIKSQVEEQAGQLQDEKEKLVCLEFHHSIMAAIEAAVLTYQIETSNLLEVDNNDEGSSRNDDEL